MLNALEQRGRNRAAEGRLDDWIAELEGIDEKLHQLLDDSEAIDDDLPDDQGRAQIALIFTRELQPLQGAIDRLGVHISRVPG